MIYDNDNNITDKHRKNPSVIEKSKTHWSVREGVVVKKQTLQWDITTEGYKYFLLCGIYHMLSKCFFYNLLIGNKSENIIPLMILVTNNVEHLVIKKKCQRKS